MLLPRALPHTLPLLRCVLRSAGLGALILVSLVLPLLLLHVLLLHVLLLSMLQVVVPLLIRALSRLLLLPLSVLRLRLSTLRIGLGTILTTLLLLPVVLPLAVLLLLSTGRSGSRGKKQRQNSCAGESYNFHRCYLRDFECVRIAL